MKGAMKMAGVNPSDIGYINMHGTGTRNNDSAEGKAVERIFHPHYPKLSSTKSFTGHTLGASGGIEAAYSAVALRDGLIFPNFTYSQPVSGLHIHPEKQFSRNQELRHVLSNSFGFGGNCTSLVFSGIEI
jgi:3-oxoacyl-[acyl-carrier-protein] synthase-1